MEMEFKDTSRRRTVVLVLGVLLAIAAGGAAFMLSSQSNAPERAGVITKTVVVAAIDIPARQTIAADAVTLRELTDDLSIASAYTDPLLVVGRVAAVPLIPNQPITPNLLATAAAGSVAILAPAETIGPNSPLWRAASVNVAPERAVGGLIAPGQRVDVFATLAVPVRVALEDGSLVEGASVEGFYSDNATKLLYTDLEILQVSEGMYVLKVDTHQAEEITHLQSLGAQFSLALRPDADNRDIDRSSYGETTTRILTQYNFPLPEILAVEGYPQPSPFPTPFPNEPYLTPAPSASPEASPPASPEAGPASVPVPPLAASPAP
jgi:Flp pilus assembly protein CpaB